MNSIDKSIFPLDSALRRRFRFYNLYPDMNVLSEHFGVYSELYSATKSSPLLSYTLEDFLILTRDFISHINSKIIVFLGEDYTLGQSYVWNLSKAKNVTEATKMFRSNLFEQILPQLEELFRNRIEQLKHIVGCDVSKNCPYLVIDPSYEEADLGANVTLKSRENDDLFSGELLIHWMENFAKS